MKQTTLALLKAMQKCLLPDSDHRIIVNHFIECFDNVNVDMELLADWATYHGKSFYIGDSTYLTITDNTSEIIIRYSSGKIRNVVISEIGSQMHYSLDTLANDLSMNRKYNEMVEKLAHQKHVSLLIEAGAKHAARSR